MDEESEITHVYEINPDMIWACRINPDEIRVYISDSSAITLSQLALDILGDAIDPFRT